MSWISFFILSMALSPLTRMESFFEPPPLFILIIELGGLFDMGQSEKLFFTLFLFFGLKLFWLGFFYSQTFGLQLWRNVIRWPVVFKTVSIQIPNYSAKPEACFGFYVNYFLHYLFETSWCFVLLLNFNIDRGFEVFLKIVDHNKLCGSANSAKL